MTNEELEALAREAENDFQRRTRVMEDFLYDERQDKYWDTTTSSLLVAKAVDGAICQDDWPTRIDRRSGEPRPYRPSLAINDIDTGLTVEGSTWWPGRPKLIRNLIVTERGAQPQKGALCYNQYVAPDRDSLRTDGDPGPWIEHVRKLYPDKIEHEHFFDFCAHMLQYPDEKLNHGLVMSGAQGIGKDTALIPVRRGVGEWNAAEIGPDAIVSQYNPYAKSVLLVINEVRPQDEDHKASNFYNLLKPLLAAPPEMTAMDIKYQNTIYVRNLCHVVLTTNDPLTMYIPEEDRRLFVMDSPLADPKKEAVFSDTYFDDLYAYLDDGGCDAVIKFLLDRPIFEFNAGAPPPMTKGKKAIIDSAHQVRRSFVDDIFERYSADLFDEKLPDVIFHRDLLQFVDAADFFDDAREAARKLNAKNFHFKMNERGYDLMRNPDAHEWRNGDYRTRMAFVRKSVPNADRYELVKAALMKRPLEMR